MGNDVGGPIGNPTIPQPWGSSVRNAWTMGRPIITTADGTDTTPAVTEEFVAEVTVPSSGLCTGFALFTGSAVAGNVQCQLYDSGGRKVATSASTVAAGVDGLQRIPWAAPVKLVPGAYYVGVQCNNVGMRLNTHVAGANGGTVKKTAQVYGTFVAFTPPTTFVANVGPMGALY